MKNKDNYKLFEKLNYYSKPYFIVCSLNASVLNDVLDIYENMVKYYLKIDDKKFGFDVRVKNKKQYQVLDIINVDEVSVMD